MIRIEPVTVDVKDALGIIARAVRWQWSCDCHDWASAPWPDRLTEATAEAEHEVVFGERQTGRVGAWVR